MRAAGKWLAALLERLQRHWRTTSACPTFSGRASWYAAHMPQGQPTWALNALPLAKAEGF